MSVSLAFLDCQVSAGAFSGEFIFKINLLKGGTYIGIAPKHYFNVKQEPSDSDVSGKLRVRLIKNGGEEAYILIPDGESVYVPADSINKAA